MKIINGDLIQLAINGHFDVIIHGCNCFNIMGAGIAKQIKKEFPKAFEADKEFIGEKLGNYSCATILDRDDVFVVVNAYTQYKIGYGSVDYNAIRSVFKKINKDYNMLRIGYPKIGCGLAGGNWTIVESIINEELKGQDHTLVIL